MPPSERNADDIVVNWEKWTMVCLGEGDERRVTLLPVLLSHVFLNDHVHQEHLQLTVTAVSHRMPEVHQVAGDSPGWQRTCQHPAGGRRTSLGRSGPHRTDLAVGSRSRKVMSQAPLSHLLTYSGGRRQAQRVIFGWSDLIPVTVCKTQTSVRKDLTHFLVCCCRC